MTRLLAIPAGLAVMVLLGVAMFHNQAADETKKALAIDPGEPAPHGERGLCTSCHLIGGPTTKPVVGGARPWSLNAHAPSIRIDQIRPHSERGPCVTCHTILPAVQINAAGSQFAQIAAPPSTAGTAFAQPPYVSRNAWGPAVLQQALPPGNGSQQLAWQGPVGPMPGVTQFPPNPGMNAPSRGMNVPNPGMNAPNPGMNAPNPGMNARNPGMNAPKRAPPITAGTPAPHGWRGECASCHTQRPAAAWQPTAPLSPPPAAAPARGPREVDGLGMAVRPTNGDVAGMMVIEIEGMARKAGLKLGDIVRAVDGQRTSDVTTFRSATRAADPTRGVVVDVVRDGKAQALVVKR